MLPNYERLPDQLEADNLRFHTLITLIKRSQSSHEHRDNKDAICVCVQSSNGNGSCTISDDSRCDIASESKCKELFRRGSGLLLDKDASYSAVADST